MEEKSVLQSYIDQRMAEGKNKTAIVDELSRILCRHPRKIWIWLKEKKEPDSALQILLKIWMSLSPKEARSILGLKKPGRKKCNRRASFADASATKWWSSLAASEGNKGCWHG